MEQSKKNFIHKRMRDSNQMLRWVNSMADKFGGLFGRWVGASTTDVKILNFEASTVSSMVFSITITLNKPSTITRAFFKNLETGQEVPINGGYPYTGSTIIFPQTTIPIGSYIVSVVDAAGIIISYDSVFESLFEITSFTPPQSSVGIPTDISIVLSGSATIVGAQMVNSVSGSITQIYDAFPFTNVSTVTLNDVTLSGGRYNIVLIDDNGNQITSSNTFKVASFSITGIAPLNVVTGSTFNPSASMSLAGANVGTSYYYLSTNPSVRRNLVLTSINPQAFLTNFNALPNGLDSGSWVLALTDSSSDAVVISSSMTISIAYTIISFTPLSANTNVPITIDSTLSQNGVINNAYMRDTFGNNFYIPGSFPISGVSSTLGIISGLPTGRYNLHTIDFFGNTQISSQVLNVRFTITAFTPSTSPISTFFTAQVTLGQNNQSIVNAQLSTNGSNYTLTRTSPTPLPSNVCSFASISIPQSGVYNLTLTDFFGNQVIFNNAITVSSPFTITSSSTNPTPLNTGTSFTSTCSLSISTTIISAYLKNTASLILTDLVPSQPFPLITNNLSFLSLSNVPSGNYVFRVVENTNFYVESVNHFSIKTVVLSFTPLNITVGTGFQLSATLGSTNETISLARLVLAVSPFTSYSLTVSSSQPLSSNVCSFSTLNIPIAGEYNLIVNDGSSNQLDCLQTLNVISQSVILSFFPSSLTDGQAFTASCTLSQITVIDSARFVKQNTGQVINLTESSSAYPVNASMFSFNNIPAGLSFGIWNMILVDEFSNNIQAVTNVTYLINSFTPVSSQANTLLTGITAVLSTSSEVITGSFAAMFRSVTSPFPEYNLTAASVSGNIISFNNLVGGLPVGTYRFKIIDSFGNTVLSSQLISLNGTTITSITTTPSIINSNVTFSSSCILNFSETIVSASFINQSTSANTSLTGNPSLPQTGTTISFANLSGGLLTGNYRLRLTNSSSDIIESSIIIPVTYLINSFTPTFITPNTTITGITSTISDSNQSILNSFVALLRLSVSPFTTYSLTPSSVSGNIISFNNFVGGLPVGTYNMRITDSFGNTGAFSTQTISVAFPTITSFTSNPSTLRSNTAFTSSCGLSSSLTVTSAGFVNQNTSLVTGVLGNPSLPQTGTTISFASLTGGLQSGNYKVRLYLGSDIIDSSLIFPVVYSINSFTPSGSVLFNTPIVGITATISEPPTGNFITVFRLTTSPFTTYSLASSNVSGNTVSYINLSGGLPVGSYNMQITDVSGNTTLSTQTLVVNNTLAYPGIWVFEAGNLSYTFPAAENVNNVSQYTIYVSPQILIAPFKYSFVINTNFNWGIARTTGQGGARSVNLRILNEWGLWFDPNGNIYQLDGSTNVNYRGNPSGYSNGVTVTIITLTKGQHSIYYGTELKLTTAGDINNPGVNHHLWWCNQSFSPRTLTMVASPV